MIDPRFGITGVSEPEVCAVSGELARGRHANRYPLPGKAYFYVLSKHVSELTDDVLARIHADFAALVAPQDTLVNDGPQKKGK